MAAYRLGVDIGGTFTDIVLLGPDGSIYGKKVLSTPDDYSEAIESGVAELLADSDIRAGDISAFAHGTTVATNTIIERRGVKVALVTTRGFRDVLELGRYRAPRLYDLDFRKPEPLVERRLRFEVDERVAADGQILRRLDEAGLPPIAKVMRDEGVEAVAVCFLNAYACPDNELDAKRCLEALLPGISVSASTQLLPQIQEYERTSTTVVNAYIRPVVETYLTTLAERMQRIGVHVPLTVMQSNGGVLPAALAGANPVYVIESGPAAGVVGSQRMAGRLALGELIVLDMGGTTAKASLIQDGEISIMPEAEVGGDSAIGHRLLRGAGYPVQVPTIDIAEVGAGGGSIAVVDMAGGVQVGPRSAGAVPGPICYGQGGDQPTVTDANLTLGYLNPGALVGGDLDLDSPAAERAIAELGDRLGQAPAEMAYGIHLIANANMIQALSAVSTERGQDPARFTLVALGGSGGVHAAGLAESLGIGRVLVPPCAGLFSALGLLFADVEHHLIRAFYRDFAVTSAQDFNDAVSPLLDDANRLLRSEGFSAEAQRQIEVQTSMKYAGQSWTLSVVCPSFPAGTEQMAALAEGFGVAHEQHYGYRSDSEAMQFVSLKVIGRGLSDTPQVPERIARVGEPAAQRDERKAYFGPSHGWCATPVLSRNALAETALDGPLIVEEYDTTTVVRPGWRVALDGWNNIALIRDAG